MRRPPKKTSVKKKVATKARPKTRKSTEFDNWAEAQKRKSGCMICRDDAVAGTVHAMLQSMVRKHSFRAKIQTMLATAQEKHPGADMGQRSLERHLRVCVRPLYDRARGRRHG